MRCAEGRSRCRIDTAHPRAQVSAIEAVAGACRIHELLGPGSRHACPNPIACRHEGRIRAILHHHFARPDLEISVRRRFGDLSRRMAAPRPCRVGRTISSAIVAAAVKSRGHDLAKCPGALASGWYRNTTVAPPHGSRNGRLHPADRAPLAQRWRAKCRRNAASFAPTSPGRQRLAVVRQLLCRRLSAPDRVKCRSPSAWWIM